MNQILNLISIQFKEFFREPGILFWSMIFPILMAWGLGIAFTGQGELIRHVAFVQNTDSTNAALSTFLEGAPTEILQSGPALKKTIEHPDLGTTQYFFHPTEWNEALRMLKRGEAAVVLKEGPELHFHFDPANPEAQLTYLQLQSIISEQAASYKAGTIRPLTRIGTRYVDFLVPGLMAMGIMMSCLWGISYSLIDKRSKKLLRRMVATPMSKTGFLFSHFVSRLSLSAVESTLLVGFSHLLFDVEIQGNIFALILLMISGNMAFTGVAMLVSSRTDNPQIGNGLINAVVMPMMIMSGIFFSYHNFPDFLIPVIQALPLTMLADGIRSIFIEGAGFAETGIPTLLLASAGLLFFFVGQRFYKWY